MRWVIDKIPTMFKLYLKLAKKICNMCHCKYTNRLTNVLTADILWEVSKTKSTHVMYLYALTHCNL